MAVEITDELVALRAQAEALGIVYDGRWGEMRLREEIATRSAEREAWLAAERGEHHPPRDELEGDEDSEGPDNGPAPTEDIRAGGHIDRGDGRGWMVEE